MFCKGGDRIVGWEQQSVYTRESFSRHDWNKAHNFGILKTVCRSTVSYNQFEETLLHSVDNKLALREWQSELDKHLIHLKDEIKKFKCWNFNEKIEKSVYVSSWTIQMVMLKRWTNTAIIWIQKTEQYGHYLNIQTNNNVDKYPTVYYITKQATRQNYSQDCIDIFQQRDRNRLVI